MGSAPAPGAAKDALVVDIRAATIEFDLLRQPRSGSARGAPNHSPDRSGLCSPFSPPINDIGAGRYVKDNPVNSDKLRFREHATKSVSRAGNTGQAAMCGLKSGSNYRFWEIRVC
jgi:hypothetical protein